MKRLWAMGGLAGLLMVGVVVGAEEEALQFKATVELRDGSRLVVSRYDGSLMIYDLRTGDHLVRVPVVR